MNQLKLIIKNECQTHLKSKGFWISTFVIPIVMVAFGVLMGYLMASSDTASEMMDSIIPTKEDKDISALQVIGLLMGMFLTFFLMMYGSVIFQKVKQEKVNRIVEVVATCVTGRTMMLAKIISVAIIGFLQILMWALLIGLLGAGLLILISIQMPWDKLMKPEYFVALGWSVLFFIGGYIFYGSLFAAVGAMTDRNNENQEYISFLTMILLLSFYMEQYAVDHGDAVFVKIMSYIPFTSPTLGAVNAITGASNIFEILLQLIVLYSFAWLSLAFAGKIYTSSILLKGKKFSPKDIITFMRTK